MQSKARAAFAAFLHGYPACALKNPSILLKRVNFKTDFGKSFVRSCGRWAVKEEAWRKHEVFRGRPCRIFQKTGGGKKIRVGSLDF
ncbi:MAG: hypothetical protein HFG27_06135 [Provencibacterium sp.]|nr:hypothetical protein [Provencibacterium sp.]